MSLTTTLLVAALTLSTPNEESNCQVAYQDATYGFHHAETAMEANNLTHLRQYAKRSKQSIEKVYESTEQCGCTDAREASLDALENLDKALAKETFESMRLFVSRAKKDTKEIFVALDVCGATDPNNIILESQASLKAKELELQEKQQQLIEAQKKLEAQLAEQAKIKEELALQKAVMLTEQKEIKRSAESSLLQLEQILLDFTQSMGCPKTTSLTEAPFERSFVELENESIQATKIFYANKAREMANNLLNLLDECEWKK